MTLRKGLALLLLTAFSLTSIAPASAVTVNQGAVLPIVAQDAGNAASGAKRDVARTALNINATAAGEFLFATDGTEITNGLAYQFSGGGVIMPTTFTIPTESKHYMTAPAGCSFVKLPAYTEVTVAGLTAPVSPANAFVNVLTPTIVSSLPDNATESNFIIAQVLDTVATDNAAVPAGSLAIHLFTDSNANQTNSGPVNITIDPTKIGIACNASDAPTITGPLNATSALPGGGPTNALLAISSGAVFQIATFGARQGKLEAITMGQSTGTITGTPSPDMQGNTLIAGQLGVNTTLLFGTGNVTTVATGVTPSIDAEPVIIRASETSVSSSTTRDFFQTPFATAASLGTLTDTANASSLSNTALTADGAVFTNTANAVITVEFELQDQSGTPLANPLLRMDQVHVALHGSQTFAGFRSTVEGSEVGGIDNVASTASLAGFLGALINPTQNANTGAALSALTDAGLVSIHDGAAGDNALTVKDAFSLMTVGTAAIEGTAIGVAAEATLNPVSPAAIIAGAPTGDFTMDAKVTNANGYFPGHQAVNANGTTGDNALQRVISTDDNAVAAGTFAIADAGGDDATYVNATRLRRTKEIVSSHVTNAGTPDGDNRIMLVHGDETAGNNSVANSIILGATNFATNTGYNQAARVKDTAGAAPTTNPVDNGVLVSKLTKTANKYVLHILPLSNRFDGVRDIASIDFTGQVTGLNTTLLAAGVKLVAKVSGNNLPGTTTNLTLFEVIPDGGFNTGLLAVARPVNGGTGALAAANHYQLMAHSTGSETLQRQLINISTVNGSTTALDDVADIVPAGLELDDTLPTIFAGGKAGNGTTRGPIAHIQPRARAICLEEAAPNDFQAIRDLGANVLVRITMPMGTDLNAYTATNTDLTGIFFTGGVTAPSIARIQNISAVASRAFIDVNLGTAAVTTNPINDKICIGLRPHLLVVPEAANLSALNVGVTIVNHNGTNAYQAVTTDDVTIGTINDTVSLGPVSNQQLMVSYDNRATSIFQAAGVTASTVRDVFTATNGAQEATLLNGVTMTNHLITTAGGVAVRLPDLKITEAAPDAIAIGSDVDGVPTLLGAFTETLNVGGTGALSLHCATTVAGLGFTNPQPAGPAQAFLFGSDVAGMTGVINNGALVLPVVGGAPITGPNEFRVSLQANTGTSATNSQKATESITVQNLQITGPGAGVVPANEAIVCWTENGGADAREIIGSVPRSLATVPGTTTNEQVFVPIGPSAGNFDDFMANAFITLGSQDNATAPAGIGLVDWGDATVGANNDVTLAKQRLTANNSFMNAIGSRVDSSNDTLLSQDTPAQVLTLPLPTLNGVADTSGDLRVEVTYLSGTLNAGNRLTLTCQNSAGSDTVRTPVGDNGGSNAALRCSPGATVTVTEAPATTIVGKDPQVQTLQAADQAVAAAFRNAIAATPAITLANRGSFAGLIDPTTIDAIGFDPATVLGTCTVNGEALQAVGTNFFFTGNAKSPNFLLNCPAVVPEGQTDPQVVTGTVTVDNSQPRVGSGLRPLRSPKIKTDGTNNIDLRLKGNSKFPNDSKVVVFYNDGTSVLVENVTLKRGRTKLRFVNPTPAGTIKAIEVISGRGSRVRELI